MTEQALAPKYAIGTTIFIAGIKSERRKHDCPDCLGSEAMTVVAACGELHTVKCPRCQGGFYGLNFDDQIPRLDYTHYEPDVKEAKITGYCVNEYRDGKIKYSSATSANSAYSFDEGDIITSRETAEMIAAHKAREANEKEEATVEAMKASYFANLTLNDARLEVFRSELWTAHYHLGNIMGELRQLIDEAGDGASVEQLQKLISDHVRWSSQYHFDHMPLAPLFKAIESLTQDTTPLPVGHPIMAVRAAWHKLPEPVRYIISKELLELSQKKVGY